MRAAVGSHEPAGVWFDDAGKPGGPVVVLVHGSMDRSAGLLRLSRRLDDDHHVIRYDRRGYGRSARCGPPWSVDANVDDLVSLVEQRVDRRALDDGGVALFGHSFGGNVALGVAARRPELVRCVVVYETPLSWLDWWPRDSAGAAALGASDSGDAAEAFMRRLVGDAAWERLPAAKRLERRAEGAAMVAELADLRRAVPWKEADVTVPVLAIRGEHARPHHRAATAHLSEHIAGCRAETVPGAGHAGPHSHAEQVAEVVRPFLTEYERSPDELTARSRPCAADG